MELNNIQRSGRKKRCSAVSAELRAELYRRHYADGQSVYSLAQEFGISYGAVSQNIAKFANEIRTVCGPGIDMSKTSDSERIKKLEAENKRLRAELTKTQLRAEFFETMVDIAEKNFNIPIKKKAGTKPPES